MLQKVAESVFKKLKTIQLLGFEAVRETYHSHVFRNDEISVFETPKGERKNGIIKGVSQQLSLIHI